MKNHRSLEGYRKYEAGFVNSVYGGMLNNNYVVIAKVVHSMKLRNSLLKPWAIIDNLGTVLSAHCDCVAGFTETCSHVSAMLYYLANLHAQSIDRRVTVTDLPAYWKQPPKRIREDLYNKVENISYGKQTKRWYDAPPSRPREDIETLLKELKSNGSNLLVLHSMCDGDQFCCSQCETRMIPDEIFTNKNILLQNNFEVEHETKTLQELRDVAATKLFRLNSEDIRRVERLTQSQYQSELWHWVRIGRITASIMKHVVCASNEFPPPKLTTLKAICHPYLKTFQTPALTYGRKNEPIARDELIKLWKHNHEEGIISTCGIFLSADHPFLAASPDAIGSCRCCGKFTVEIKCPFRLSHTHLDRQLTIEDLATKPNSFVRFKNGIIELAQEHEYYYQIQAQIFLTNSDFGLCMIWCKTETNIIKITKNENVWGKCLERSRLYFYNIVMPELLGNYYTNKMKNTQREIVKQTINVRI
ncbi:uncharacterized protein LOC134204525 isoform X2 [Armigeres subalbatus]